MCGCHGWHDWYLAANRAPAGQADPLQGHLLPGLAPAGAPSQLAGTALPFAYNNLDQLAGIVRREAGRLAAADEVFVELADAMRRGDASARIGGPIRRSGFARLA